MTMYVYSNGNRGINAIPGITAAKLFTLGTDTVVATASSVTAGTNDASWYDIAFADVTSTQYRLVLYIGTTVVGSGTVTAGDGAIDINDVGASDPGKRTGYVVCYDETGTLEPGVVVSCQCYYAPDTGLALDTKIRTAISDASGLAQFTNMIVGAKYDVWRGSYDKKVKVTVESGTGPVALTSLVGREEA